MPDGTPSIHSTRADSDRALQREAHYRNSACPSVSRMNRAIDCLVNVDLGDKKQPEWMVRVKEDYFKGGESFLASPELPELIEDMDAHGVERAIVLSKLGLEGDRGLRYVNERPDRLALGVGGLNLLRPVKTMRALESFVRDNPV